MLCVQVHAGSSISTAVVNGHSEGLSNNVNTKRQTGYTHEITPGGMSSAHSQGFYGASCANDAVKAEDSNPASYTWTGLSCFCRGKRDIVSKKISTTLDELREL